MTTTREILKEINVNVKLMLINVTVYFLILPSAKMKEFICTIINKTITLISCFSLSDGAYDQIYVATFNVRQGTVAKTCT